MPNRNANAAPHPDDRSDLPLNVLLKSKPLGAGRYLFSGPGRYHQGRGLWGGIVLGALAQAAIDEEANTTRALRSLIGTIPAPVTRELAEIQVELLRKGSALSTYGVTMRQNGDVVATATALLAKKRSDTRIREPEAPAELRAGSPGVLPFPVPPAPEFSQSIHFAPMGALPYTGEGDGTVAGYIHPHVPLTALNDATVVALADAYYATTLPLETDFRAVGTIAFSLHVCPRPEGLDATRPIFHRARLVTLAEGYLSEYRELWSHDGHLLSVNQQTICMIT